MRCRSNLSISVTVAIAGVTLTGAPVGADEAWLDRSRAILEQAAQQPRPIWLDRNPEAEASVKQQALEALRSSQLPQALAEASAAREAEGRHYVLYASMSLGESGVRDLLEEAAGRDDVVVVFRGVRPGQKLPEFTRELHALTRSFEEDRQPEVVIDPERFDRAGVTVVPTLTLEENGHVLAKVTGIIGTRWLQAKVANTPGGDSSTAAIDLGTQGPTKDILEPNLIDEFKRRVAQVDWEGKKREALARFWKNTSFYDLPPATADRERVIDLTVTAPYDVTAPDGRVVVQAGQRVNPLDLLPFTQRLVIFDPTRPGQPALARSLGQGAGPRRVTYIATRLDRDSGWKALENLESALDAPVYLLTPDVRARFKLEFVPTVVEARGNTLIVRETREGGRP